MPHVLIKHFPLNISEQDKKHIADHISDILSTGFGCSDDVVSVSMLTVEPELWNEKVYQPDIEKMQDILIKKPSY